MTKNLWRIGLLTMLVANLIQVSACSRKSTQSGPDAAATAGGPAAALPQGATGTFAGPGATSSEEIATNKPDPACKDCQHADASNGPTYFGKPDGKLDDKTLGELQAIIDQNNALIEGGIEILEKNAKTPDKALVEMDKYLADKIHEVEGAHTRAAEIRARLKQVGYDQDVPAEIRPAFEARMGKIAERLERMREVYATRRDVLQSFGKLFARGK